jgi:hypothetical protein
VGAFCQIAGLIDQKTALLGRRLSTCRSSAPGSDHVFDDGATK